MATQTRTLMTQGGEGSSVCSGNTGEAKLSNPSEIVNRRWRKSRNRKDPEERIAVSVAAIREMLVTGVVTGLREATAVAHPPAAREAQTTMTNHLATGTISPARPQKAAMTASSSTTTQRLTTVNMPMLRTTSHRATPIMDRTAATEAGTSNEDQARPLGICGATLMATGRAEAPI